MPMDVASVVDVAAARCSCARQMLVDVADAIGHVLCQRMWKIPVDVADARCHWMCQMPVDAADPSEFARCQCMWRGQWMRQMCDVSFGDYFFSIGCIFINFRLFFCSLAPTRD